MVVDEDNAGCHTVERAFKQQFHVDYGCGRTALRNAAAVSYGITSCKNQNPEFLVVQKLHSAAHQIVGIGAGTYHRFRKGHILPAAGSEFESGCQTYGFRRSDAFVLSAKFVDSQSGYERQSVVAVGEYAL